jgi:hypothetical protein
MSQKKSQLIWSSRNAEWYIGQQGQNEDVIFGIYVVKEYEKHTKGNQDQRRKIPVFKFGPERP